MAVFKENKKMVQICTGTVILTIAIGSLFWFNIRKNAYCIKVDGETIAVVKTKEEVNQAYQEVVTSLKESLGVDIAVNQQFEIEAIHSDKSELDDYQTLVELLEDAIKYEVEAYEILVDGKSYAVVASKEEASHVLAKIAKSHLPRTGKLTLSQEVAPSTEAVEAFAMQESETASSGEIIELADAMPEESVSNVVHVASFELNEQEEETPQGGQKILRNVSSFDFNEEVVIRNVYVDAEKIVDEAKAEENLKSNVKEVVDYTLVEGDNLWDIAMQYDTTPERILELNTEILDETKMQIGQVIKIEKSVPILSTTTVEEATFKQIIPAEIQYVVFSHLYVGQTQVYQEGSDGLKEVTVSVTKVNGKETSRELVSENVLSEPVIKVIGYGVKKKPVSEASLDKATSGQFIHPLKGAGRVSSTYGSRWGGFHKGIDYAASAGTPIYASDGGKVIYSGYNSGGYGKLIIIEHDNGFQTYYAHCSKLYANVGDRVGKGQRIAGVGSTGDSTGNHLHFEIRENGTPVNPSKHV